MIIAIVPAAGLSSRMGRPKPLLDIGGEPLLARVVKALLAGGAGGVIVVAPPNDRAESAEIARCADEAGAVVAIPSHQKGDMRGTIEIGLARAEMLGTPSAILLSPCDTPDIGPELVRCVIEVGCSNAGSIVVPRSRSGRGHPAYLPWELARSIRDLRPGLGVNSLLDHPRYSIVEVDWHEPLGDIDTPEDYRLWLDGRDR